MDLKIVLLILVAAFLIYLIVKKNSLFSPSKEGMLSVLGRGCSGSDIACPNIMGIGEKYVVDKSVGQGELYMASRDTSLMATDKPERYMASRDTSLMATDKRERFNNSGQMDYDSIGGRMIRENMENFTTCGGNLNNWMTSSCGPCATGDDNRVDFSVNPFGAPGVDYKEFVASQAIDNKTLANHVQYVEDRAALAPGGVFTGRTFSPDSHMSFDPIYWLGLRRPDYVNECNPTQSTGLTKEDQTRLYKGDRLFCLRT
jgi:hypothetical protein